MATKVVAPRLGEGVNELTIVRWLKEEGQPVKELESLLEVETDKVVTEIPSPASGTLLRETLPRMQLPMWDRSSPGSGSPGRLFPEMKPRRTGRFLSLKIAAV